MPTITTLSFDGDMTLWDFQKVMQQALSITLSAIKNQIKNQKAQALTPEDLINTRNQVANEMAHKALKLEDIRLLAFERTLDQIGSKIAGFAHHLHDLYLRHRFEAIELYDDVLPLFSTLPSQYTLVFLSNGNSYPDRCGLKDCFDFVFLAQDVNIQKPDPRIFEYCAQSASFNLHELVHIGDSLETDVAGANGVGATSVWLNRDNQRNHTGIQPDFEISSLLEIPTLLEKIGLP